MGEGHHLVYNLEQGLCFFSDFLRTTAKECVTLTYGNTAQHALHEPHNL